MLRYPTSELAPNFNEAQRVGERMNRDVLSLSTFRRLVVEVDWVETAAPAEIALDALRDTLVEFAPDGYEITIEKSDEIPYETWESVGNELPFDGALLNKHVDFLQQKGSLLAAGEGELLLQSETTTNLYILYVPKLPNALYGYFDRLKLTYSHPETGAELGTASLPLIVVSKGAFRDSALLWLKAEKIERGTIVHELGHYLGLVSNPRHGVTGNLIHCANPSCSMSHPRWRSILRNVPLGLQGEFPFAYGSECRRDIEMAKSWWISSGSSPPDSSPTN